jgi:putative spermidine/putrescine transport system permease protein
MAHVVIAFPVAFAVLSNALSNVDASLEPAAWTLGASRTAAFWSIVVRSIIPSVAGAFVLSFMVSWDEVVIALFQTGFEKTLPVTIFAYLQAGIVPTVPAIATMLIGVVVIGFTLAWIVRSRATAARTKKASSEGAL